jgi:DNA-binding transcriptional LysR family regulator
VKSHIAALQDIQAGTVDVYCFQTAIESFVAPVLHRFHVQYPGVLFNVRMSSTDEAMEALVSGAAEIGLILNPPIRDAIESTEVFRDTIVAVVSPSHPLAKRKVVALSELAKFPFVLTEPSFGLRQQVDEVFHAHRIAPEMFCVTNSLALTKSVAGVGLQCTLLPRFAVAPETTAGMLCTITVREFAARSLVFSVCTLKGHLVSPAAKVFVGAVIDYCRRYRR